MSDGTAEIVDAHHVEGAAGDAGEARTPVVGEALDHLVGADARRR